MNAWVNNTLLFSCEGHDYPAVSVKTWMPGLTTHFCSAVEGHGYPAVSVKTWMSGLATRFCSAVKAMVTQLCLLIRECLGKLGVSTYNKWILMYSGSSQHIEKILHHGFDPCTITTHVIFDSYYIAMTHFKSSQHTII